MVHFLNGPLTNIGHFKPNFGAWGSKMHIFKELVSSSQMDQHFVHVGAVILAHCGALWRKRLLSYSCFTEKVPEWRGPLLDQPLRWAFFAIFNVTGSILV